MNKTLLAEQTTQDVLQNQKSHMIKEKNYLHLAKVVFSFFDFVNYEGEK